MSRNLAQGPGWWLERSKDGALRLWLVQFDNRKEGEPRAVSVTFGGDSQAIGERLLSALRGDA